MSEYIPSRIRHRVRIPDKLSPGDIKKAVAYGFRTGALKIRTDPVFNIETLLRQKSMQRHP